MNIVFETQKVGTGAESGVIVDLPGRVSFLCYESMFWALKPSAGMMDSSARASHRMLRYCFAPYIILDNPTCSLDRFKKCCESDCLIALRGFRISPRTRGVPGYDGWTCLTLSTKYGTMGCIFCGLRQCASSARLKLSVLRSSVPEY